MPAGSSMLAVAAALRDEVSLALRRGDFRPTAGPASMLTFRSAGQAGVGEVLVLVTGWGREAASAGARWLADHARPAGIVSVGYSGGAAPGLLSGALVIGIETVLVDRPGGPGDGPVLASSAELVSVAKDASVGLSTPVRSGPIGTTPAIVHLAAEKRRLGEDSGVLAVDLESWHTARVAADAGIPFVAVRAIVDPVGTDLPGFVSKVPPGPAPAAAAAALRYVAANPRRLPAVVRTGIAASKARRSLASFLLSLPSAWAGRAQPITADAARR